MVRFLFTVLVFAVLGPLIGAVPVALATGTDFEPTFFILAYVVGGVPFLLAGAAIAVVRIVRGSAGFVALFIAGLMAALVITFHVAGIRSISRLDWCLTMVALACVLATFACWGIVMAIYRPSSSEAEAAS